MNGTKEKRKKIKLVKPDNIISRKKSKDIQDNVVNLADKRKTTVKRFTLGSTILILFMLLYIPSFLNWMSGNNVARDIIRNGIIEKSINTDAIIIRNEELLKPAGSGGRMISEIGEGEKTPAFTRIATILNTESAGLLQDMEEINAKILKARIEKAEKADFFSEDLLKLDKEIGQKVQSVINACNARDFKDLSAYRSEIGKIVEKKAEIVGENSTDSYINGLKQQKESIQRKLDTNTVEIVSNISGIVSYTIDGYESILTPEGISDLSPEKVEGILEGYSVKQDSDMIAAAGQAPAKIIKGTDIYLAAAIDSESAESFKEGDNIKMRINDVNIETSAVITNVGIPEGKNTVVTVKTSRGLDILSNVRAVNVDFITKREEGLKVPVRCLRNFSQDGLQADIMLIKFNVSSVRTADIICMDGE